MNQNNRIAQDLNLQPRQVKVAIQLLDEGNTIPFIARYRKEMTFNLNDLQLRQIEQESDVPSYHENLLVETLVLRWHLCK